MDILPRNALLRNTFLVLVVVFSLPEPARAEIIVDPLPHLHWKEMLNCELVVVGKYKSHKGTNQLSLEVVRVFKGNHTRTGDVIHVKLDHWYSIETRPVGADLFFRNKSKPDGVPRLCYKRQIMNPGGAMPVQIVPDVKKLVVYFFPNEMSPTLRRQGQVQRAFLADGWEQAIDGKPMDLFFRLMQRVDPALHDEALEVLCRTRTPAVLDRLFALRSDPLLEWEYPFTTVRQMLLKLGDKNGDIYDRAWKAFHETPPKGREFLKYEAAEIFCNADPPRAWRDLRRLLQKGTTKEKNSAAYCIGYIGTEKSLLLLVDLLKEKDLRQEAYGSLHTLLQPCWHNPRPAGKLARLRQLAEEKLKELLASEKTPAALKKKLRMDFRDLLQEPPRLNMQNVRKYLLDPSHPCYQRVLTGKAGAKWQAIVHAYDPKVIPLLMDILMDIPVARQGKCPAFGQVMLKYAQLCPNTMRREILRTGAHRILSKETARSNSWKRYFSAVPRFVGWKWDTLEVAPSFAVRRKLLLPAELKLLRRNAREKRIYPLNLQRMLAADLAEGKQIMEWAFDHMASVVKWDRVMFLRLAVEYGYSEKRQALEKLSKEPLLPLTGDPPEMRRYLKALDSKLRVESSRDGRFRDLSPDYAAKLRELFPEYPAPYFERVLALLESEEKPMREAGQQLLEKDFYWNFDFQAADLKPVRDRKLVRIRRLLRRFRKTDLIGMWAILLRELGVQLEGEPGHGWLPALKKAAVSYHPGIAANALRLIGTITRDERAFQLLSIPPVRRRKAVEVWFQDREEEWREKPLSKKTLDQLWENLASEDHDRAYHAMREMIAAPQSCLKYLRQHLKPPAAVSARGYERLIADLDSDSFKWREKAQLELRKIGYRAEPYLRRTLKNPPSLEAALRIQKLLRRLEEWTPRRLQLVRAIDVLEHLDTPQAQRFMKALGGGPPGTQLTREAHAAYRRMVRRR